MNDRLAVWVGLAALAVSSCFDSQPTDEFIEPCREAEGGAWVCEVGSGGHEIRLEEGDSAGLRVIYPRRTFPRGGALRILQPNALKGEAPDGFFDPGCPVFALEMEEARPVAGPFELALPPNACPTADFPLDASHCTALKVFQRASSDHPWEETEASEAAPECFELGVRGTVAWPEAEEGSPQFKLLIEKPLDADQIELQVEDSYRCATPNGGDAIAEEAPCDLYPFEFFALSNESGKLTGTIESPFESRLYLQNIDLIAEPTCAPIPSDQSIVFEPRNNEWSLPAISDLSPGDTQAYRIVACNLWDEMAVWPGDLEEPGSFRIDYRQVDIQPSMRTTLDSLYVPAIDRLVEEEESLVYYIPGPLEEPHSAALEIALGNDVKLFSGRGVTFAESERGEKVELAFYPTPDEGIAFDPELKTVRLVDIPLETEGTGSKSYRYQIVMSDSFGPVDFPEGHWETRRPILSLGEISSEIERGAFSVPIYFHYDESYFNNEDRFGEPLDLNDWNIEFNVELSGWKQGQSAPICPRSSIEPPESGSLDEEVVVILPSEFDCELREADFRFILKKSPPEPVMELGRILFDSRGSPSGFERATISLGFPQEAKRIIKLTLEGLTVESFSVPDMPVRGAVISNEIPDDTPPVLMLNQVCEDDVIAEDGDCIHVSTSRPRVCFDLSDPEVSSGLALLEIQDDQNQDLREPFRFEAVDEEGQNIRILSADFGECGKNPGDLADCEIQPDPTQPTPRYGSTGSMNCSCLKIPILPIRPADGEAPVPQIVRYTLRDRSGNSIRNEELGTFCYDPPDETLLRLIPDEDATAQRCAPSDQCDSMEGACLLGADRFCGCFSFETIPATGVDFKYRFTIRDALTDEIVYTRLGDDPCLDSTTEAALDYLPPGQFELEVGAEEIVSDVEKVQVDPHRLTIEVPYFELPRPFIIGPPPVLPIDLDDAALLCRINGTNESACPADAVEIDSLDLHFDIQSNDPDAEYEIAWAKKNSPDFVEEDYLSLADGSRTLTIDGLSDAAFRYYSIRVDACAKSRIERCRSLEGEPSNRAQLDFRIVQYPDEPRAATNTPQTRILQLPTNPISIPRLSFAHDPVYYYAGPMKNQFIEFRYRLTSEAGVLGSDGSPLSAPLGIDGGWIDLPKGVPTLPELIFCEPGAYLLEIQANNAAFRDPSPLGALLEVQFDPEEGPCTAP